MANERHRTRALDRQARLRHLHPEGPSSYEIDPFFFSNPEVRSIGPLEQARALSRGILAFASSAAHCLDRPTSDVIRSLSTFFVGRKSFLE